MVDINAATLIPLRFGRSYSALKEFCPQVRGDIAAAFVELGLSDDGIFAASLVVSELFTNAILHHAVSCGEVVHVGIYESTEASERWFGVAVTDGGSGTAGAAKHVAPSRQCFGRGLNVVRGMGARLTDVRVPGGYTVTAWFPDSDQLRGRVCQCDCLSAHCMQQSVCSWVAERCEDAYVTFPDDQSSLLCSGCRRLLHETAAPATEGDARRKDLKHRSDAPEISTAGADDAETAFRAEAMTPMAAVR